MPDQSTPDDVAARLLLDVRDERLLSHFQQCRQCQRAGFWPDDALANRVAARRSAGFWPDPENGAVRHCAEGTRLAAAAAGPPPAWLRALALLTRPLSWLLGPGGPRRPRSS